MEEKKVQGRITFPKDKLLQSLKYSQRKDIVEVVLDDGKDYTFEEVDKKIEAYMKRKVK